MSEPFENDALWALRNSPALRNARMECGIAATEALKSTMIVIADCVDDPRLRTVFERGGALVDVSGAIAMIDRIKAAAILAEQTLRLAAPGWPTQADYDALRGGSSSRAPGSQSGDEVSSPLPAPSLPGEP